MTSKQLVYQALLLTTLALLTFPAVADAQMPSQQGMLALTHFQKHWQPLTGKQYMRPLNDSGWKARMEAFVKLAQANDAAVPAVVEALKKGDTETRVFAAQALALLPEAGAKPALMDALQDKHPAVRLYALDALSMFGKLAETPPFTTLRDKDSNRDVRAHAKFAIERDDQPDPQQIRKALLDFQPKQMGIAKLGEMAPDFTLKDTTGKMIKLSDYRGKKPVVLVFVYGDT